jgi:hypothetical protein
MVSGVEKRSGEMPACFPWMYLRGRSGELRMHDMGDDGRRKKFFGYPSATAPNIRFHGVEPSNV